MKNIQLETNNGGRYVKEELSMCFHLFADNSPDGMIITNSDDTILYINPSAQRLLNYHEDGNGSLSSFIPTDEVKTYWDKPTTINYNRKTLYVSVKTANLKDSPLYLWYISDNTLYKQQANELYCLKTILDCVDEGIVMSDQENKITLYNKSYADHEGLSQDEVVGKHLDEVYDSNVHATALKTGLPITDIYKTYSTRNGIEQEGMGKTYPVIKNNEVIAVFSVVKNVSVVRSLLQKAVELQEKLTNKMEPNGTKYTFESIIGESEVMVNTIKKARVVAMSPSPILIYGETGTGCCLSLNLTLQFSPPITEEL